MTDILRSRGVLKADYLKALATSREVIRAAEEAARDIEIEARTRGYAAGMARAGAAVAAAEQERRRSVERAEADIAALVMEVSRCLALGDPDPRTVARLCREAVRRAAGARRVTLRVPPGQRELLVERAWARGLTVVEDDAISPGGCVVESEEGVVDARIETRLDSLERALEEKVRGRGMNEE
jgi:flagellar assembly protein FliH